MARKKVSTEKKAKPAASRAVFDSIREWRQFQFQELCQRAQRLGRAAKARFALLERLAPQMGINLDEVRRQQEADWQLLQEQIKEQEKAATALLKKQSVRQRQALRTIMANADRFDYKKGNLHTTICLWKAVAPPNIIFNP